MKNKYLGLFTGLLLVLSTQVAHATLIDAGFRWTGDAGYLVEGLFTYDDSYTIVSAIGAGPTIGLEELTVSFYDPSMTLLATHDDVTGGVSNYGALEFHFDTTLMQFVDGTRFDMGWDSYPNSVVGDMWIVGVIGSYSQLNAYPSPLDQITNNTTLEMFSVSEPSSLSLLGLGIAALGFMRHIKRRQA